MTEEQLRRLLDILLNNAKDSGQFANCLNCGYWKDGCGLANGAIPPPAVIVKGCSEHTHFIPF